MRRSRTVRDEIATVAAVIVTLAFTQAWAGDPGPPCFARVRDAHCPSDLRLLDRHGETLHETRVDPDLRRLAWAPLADISPAVIDAVIASEDQRFASHHGVDWTAIAAAAWNRILHGPPRGASTLTMQLVALLEPTLERGAAPRSLMAKVAQMRAALDLERTWSKHEILEAYLNRVTFRGEVRGIGAAAHAFFAKAPHGLTRAEGVALAASLRAPNASGTDLLRRATRLAEAFDEPGAQTATDTSAMHESEFDAHTHSAANDIFAAVERLSSAPDRSGPRVRLALHAARILAATVANPPETIRTESAANPAAGCYGGRDIGSSLDRRIQETAARALHRHLVELEDRSARDGAVLVVDNATGEVLAYVGSSGELSPAAEVDGIQAHRQAGSTLKPFLYAAAIDRGLVTPATLLEDSPLEVPLDGGVFAPANYDERFRGLVSVRSALASSLNIPAVRALLLVGADTLVRDLRTLGMDGVREDGDFYGPSLALGSADVSLWQLVGAYRALAAGGVFTPLRWNVDGRDEATPSLHNVDGRHEAPPLRRNVDGGDTDPPRPSRDKSPPVRAFGEEAAFLIGDMLADREGRAAAFGLDSALSTRFWSAAKTGTSKDMRDNWCIGFSRRFTVGVWVGNFSGAPMRDVSGVAGAAPIWQDVMEALHEGEPGDAPSPPPSIVTAWTNFAGEVEPARREYYRRGSEPSAPRSELASLPRIVDPADGSIVAIDPDIPAERQRIVLRAAAAGNGSVWRLDGREVGDGASPLAWPPVRGRHELVLVDAGARAVDSVRFEVRGGAALIRP